MSRYEITNDKGKWEFGWDPPLLTFFLQLSDPELEKSDPDANPVIWEGSRPCEIYEVDDLVRRARREGLDIPHGTQVALYGDKDEGR
jgi:hypothetical protein